MADFDEESWRYPGESFDPGDPPSKIHLNRPRSPAEFLTGFLDKGKTEDRGKVYNPSGKPPEPSKAHQEFSTWLDKIPEADNKDTREFDDDEYLIDPETYYKQLDMMEELVVEASEFYGSNGVFDPAISHIEEDNAVFSSLHCKAEVWKCLDKIAGSSGISSIAPNEMGHNIVCIGLSLGHTYIILCYLLDCFAIVSQKGFCKDSFTLLIRRDAEQGNVAELIQIERKMLVEFLEAIGNTVLKVLKPGRPLSNAATSSAITDNLVPICRKLLEYLGAPLTDLLTFRDVLFLCRTLALLFDLGLVSYVGSHGSRFDLNYMQEDHSELLVASHPESKIGFRLSLQRLACLEEFLNDKKVWVFQPLWTMLEDKQSQSSQLTILTSREAFADTWGPMWEVSAGQEHPDYVRKLIVSTGVICRVRTQTKFPALGPIRCHWFGDAKLFPTLKPGDNAHDVFIKKSRKLLIGGLPDIAFGANKACTYKLDDLERDFGLRMTPLGTSASAWAVDERQIGFSASQYVGITFVGTQKKLPRTTQKQAIWNKWKNSPMQANSLILNSYLGVEISHCTGNARRVPLRHLFTMKPIQALLARQFPEWLTSEFGADLQAAFFSDHDQEIEDVWIKHYKSRGEIAELVCCVFELLEKTGTRASNFSAAFLNQNRELSMPIELHLNNWCEFLEDSHLTAVYAIINENCLGGTKLGHFIAGCNSVPPVIICFTALETKIAVPQEETSSSKIRLNRRGGLQRLSNPDDEIQILTWEMGKVRELGRRLLRSKETQPLGREVQNRYELGGKHVPVVMKATVPSYGGLATRRSASARLPLSPPESMTSQDGLCIIPAQ
ncbi:hypothetical protein BKA65DRAFT_225077 [Rhexocercosporidium sp. MPI-PUGE-AT-0058]|nr:hypothetical protein BKA65DRAFT_225077 [Rhexocercosporidium sp. MPI-PUGE-AT-0058]